MQTRHVRWKTRVWTDALHSGKDKTTTSSHRTRASNVVQLCSFDQRKNRRQSMTPAVSALPTITHRGPVGCATADTRQATASRVKSFARWSI